MISDILTTVVTRYRADATDQIAEIKKLKGEERELAQAELDAAEARNTQARSWIGQLGQISIALGAAKVAIDGYKLGIEQTRLETQAAGINVDRLSDAFGGLQSRMEVLEFAAKSQSGALKLNQQDLEAVAGAVRALGDKGYDGAAAMKAFETAIVSGKDRGLQQFGIIVDKTGLQTDEFGAKIDTLGQKHEMLRRVVDAARASTADFNFTQAEATEGADRNSVALKNSLDDLKIAFGNLVSGMQPAIAELTTLVTLATDLAGIAKDIKDSRDKSGEGNNTLRWEDLGDFRNYMDPSRIGRRIYSNYKNPQTAWDGTPAQIVPPNIDEVMRQAEQGTAEQFTDMAMDVVKNGWDQFATEFIDFRTTFNKDADEAARLGREHAKQAAEEWKSQHAKILETITKTVKDDGDALVAQLTAELAAGDNTIHGSGEYVGPEERKKRLAEGLPFGADDLFTLSPLTKAQLTPDAGAGSLFTGSISSPDLDRLSAMDGVAKDLADALKRDQIAGGEQALSKIFGPLDEFKLYEQAFKGIEKASTAAFNAWIEGSESAGAAFKKAIGKSIEALADQMLVRSISEAAWAIGDLAIGNIPGAELHGIAAAKFAAGALVAGAVAHEMGASWGVGTAGGSGGGSNGSGSGSAPPSRAAPNVSGAPQVAPSQGPIIVYADAFAASSPGERQRVARQLVDAALGGQGGSSR